MNLSDLRRPCEHGRYDQYLLGVTVLNQSRQWEIRPEGGGWCPGGSSVTTKDLIDALVEEGVLTTEMYVTGFRRQDKQWRYVGVDWHEVTEVEVDPLLIREEQ